MEATRPSDRRKRLMAAKTAAPPRLLRIPQVADVLGCSRGHVYNLIAAGQLDTVDIAPPGNASKTRVPESSVTAYVASRLANAKQLRAS